MSGGLRIWGVVLRISGCRVARSGCRGLSALQRVRERLLIIGALIMTYATFGVPSPNSSKMGLKNPILIIKALILNHHNTPYRLLKRDP